MPLPGRTVTPTLGHRVVAQVSGTGNGHPFGRLAAQQTSLFVGIRPLGAWKQAFASEQFPGFIAWRKP